MQTPTFILAISALTAKFIHEKDPHAVIFQAPLFYNWGLDRVSFVTRVTGLLRSTLMMGALIPFNINSMSIFSFSLRLCIDGDFVHSRLGLSIKDQRWLFVRYPIQRKKYPHPQKIPNSGDFVIIILVIKIRILYFCSPLIQDIKWTTLYAS